MQINRCRILIVLAAILLSAASAGAQSRSNPSTSPGTASAAYAEVLLRATELTADLEAIASDYTEDSPKVLDLKFEIDILNGYLKKLAATDAASAGKLTEALGKLVVRRVSLEAELHRLSRTLNADHPDMRRAKRRFEIFDAAVKKVIP